MEGTDELGIGCHIPGDNVYYSQRLGEDEEENIPTNALSE
jgi:hypothetical protein